MVSKPAIEVVEMRQYMLHCNPASVHEALIGKTKSISFFLLESFKSMPLFLLYTW